MENRIIGPSEKYAKWGTIKTSIFAGVIPRRCM
jgi:hypothetical protein